MSSDPHRDQPVLQAGAPLEQAIGAVILLHGRGGSAEDILQLADVFDHPGLIYLAPQAASQTWYPQSFLAPLEQNEPWRTSALKKVRATLQHANSAGLATKWIVICGFSQGACLSTEFMATHPAKYAGLIAFTGGLMGPPDSELSYHGDLEGTPVFFSSGDPDAHVPWTRVAQSAEIFKGMHADMTLRRYPGRSHTISVDEIQIAKQLLTRVFGT